MNKKKNNYFFIILGMLFVIFVSYIIAYNSGYYEMSNLRRAKITEEKKEEFENDVKNGENVEIKDYISDDYIDYSSAMSKVGSSLSNSINKFVESGLSDFFNTLGRLFV
jgi:hypothetical protein